MIVHQTCTKIEDFKMKQNFKQVKYQTCDGNRTDNEDYCNE